MKHDIYYGAIKVALCQNYILMSFDFHRKTFVLARETLKTNANVFWADTTFLSEHKSFVYKRYSFVSEC